MQVFMVMVMAVAFALLGAGAGASACSVSPDWRPPTVETAWGHAQVVVQAKVLVVQREAGVSLATVNVERVLKGRYSGDRVETGAASLCGIGTFQVGQTYVLFFEHRGNWWVDALVQPHTASARGPRLMDASEVIPAVTALLMANGEKPGAWVSEADWDLPPYETRLSTLNLLAERDRQYQLETKQRSWLVGAGLALAIVAGVGAAAGLRRRWLRTKGR